MSRFEVRENAHPVSGEPRYAVVDTNHDDLPVARFDSRGDAQAHADKLEQGPLDWDEQEAWQDDWDDDRDDDRGSGEGDGRDSGGSSDGGSGDDRG